MMRVYLDYAATTPLDSEVEEVMRPYQFLMGNASSVHREGSIAKEALEEARERLGRALGCSSRELVFTSGGTEANNQVLFGLGLAHGGQIVTTAIEHSAVLAPARALELSGRCEVIYLEPNAFGVIQPEQVLEAITPQTILVSIMHVNNEIGSLQDVRAISEICRAKGIVLHVDAVQSLGCVPLNVLELGCDLLTVSAHKFYGPKGVGALFVRRGLELPPLLYGGHQESGLRGGTHNVPGAAGMGFAAEKAVKLQPQESVRLTALRNAFQTLLLENANVSLNGHPTQRSPRHVNVTARGVDGEALLMNLDLEGIAASSGSACSAGTLEPSHVLTALGRSPDEARASIRFSLGRDTTLEQLEFAGVAFQRALQRSSLD